MDEHFKKHKQKLAKGRLLTIKKQELPDPSSESICSEDNKVTDKNIES